ncbi:hypothetical protein A5N78_08055 [Prescottella equi]|jgi:hypothetical protein|uniref:Uncharacterized protein n=1 Tax=Rhodococcus hoagii TaxID=43767 RepID=A0A1Z1UYV7_RHOHA|nr:DUF5313 family protein [Prescottella equi]ARX60583.1 hypothetical protein pVAPB1413_0803 [Prescottella equi]ARX60688.1 hypothetical protein pVAPB1533_0803 [Prescottella equi]ORL32470.1 hypothetical protein A6I91_12025 [Prescottella equi]ORL91160.1 hypothetical protein A5N78_08055 [Prescottella equi]ORM23049.1 hypothetical protein A5N70_02520 [Prescottella equi]
MQSSTPTRTPTARQRFAYLAGRPLPPDLHEWVIADVTGPGATRRYAVRCLIPLAPILATLLFIPGPWLIRISMVLLLFLPFVYFLIALKNIYLRHRLVSHGLDPKFLDKRKQSRLDKERGDYETRYRHTR